MAPAPTRSEYLRSLPNPDASSAMDVSSGAAGGKGFSSLRIEAAFVAVASILEKPVLLGLRTWAIAQDAGENSNPAPRMINPATKTCN